MQSSKPPSSPSAFIDRLVDIIDRRGNEAYLGESVSQQQHFLQAAWFAETAGCDDHTIVAALLHDVGHFSDEFPEDTLLHGINNYHDETGERMLKPWFPDSVTRPVALHVNAKRYLCAVEPDYFEQLSPASVDSLRLQGGPLKAEEISIFEQQPWCQQGVAIRRFDDKAKDPDLETPPLDHFMPMVRATLKPYSD